ncbi:hypothetical protein ACFQ78_33480 [Streptomyces sp. NPDC056519]|uniref:hypothetical protein n=1 Tax=Streptomyces sp. NPDC056519 TaxID=3345849 RepID=UPI0036B8025F
MNSQATPTALRSQARTVLRPATFLDAVASEWIKIRTHRGVLLALLFGILITVAAGANNTSATVNDVRAGGAIGNSGSLIWTTQFGMKFGVIAFAVAGALAMTSEYSSGMIRSSLSAVPSRGRLLAAKATAFTAAALAASLTASAASYAIGSSLLSGTGEHLSLDDPGVLRAVIGGGFFLATAGLLSLTLGAVLRNPVATVSAVFALILPIPGILGPDLGRRTPFEGGIAFTLADNPGPSLPLSDSATAWTGYLTLLAWTAATAAAAYTVMKGRDA